MRASATRVQRQLSKAMRRVERVKSVRKDEDAGANGIGNDARLLGPRRASGKVAGAAIVPYTRGTFQHLQRQKVGRRRCGQGRVHAEARSRERTSRPRFRGRKGDAAHFRIAERGRRLFPSREGRPRVDDRLARAPPWRLLSEQGATGRLVAPAIPVALGPRKKRAARLGLEPRTTDPESAVLPITPSGRVNQGAPWRRSPLSV